MPATEFKVEAQAVHQDGRVSARLVGSPGVDVRPGHMFSGYRPGHDWHCHTLVPIALSASGFSVLLPEAADWPPGATLVLRGPMGNGFSPPESSRRWLLIAFGDADLYLHPLVALGLANGRAVAFVSDRQTHKLPPAVEVLTDPEDGLAWADYIAIGMPFDRLDSLSVQMRDDAWRMRSLTQDDLLVVGPTPCGIGGCQACALEGQGARRLFCVDGPMFRLPDIRT